MTEGTAVRCSAPKFAVQTAMDPDGGFMKRTFVYALLAVACGDDSSATAATGDSGSSSGHATTHGDASTSASASASAETTDGLTTEDDTTTASGSSSSGGGDTSTAGSSSGDDGSSSTGGTGDGCLPPEILAALDQHAHDLDATAGLLATHPSANEVTGFMLAPALPAPPALAASFAGPLVMICSAPLVYDEFCEEGRCQQIECTGEGAGWINHVWIEPAFDDDPWTFEEVHLHLRWSGGTGTLFDITTTAAGPGGVDMSLTGEGVMDVDSMSVRETFPALHPAGLTVLEYADDAGGFSGQLTIADVVVAQVDVVGHLEPTGDCP